MSGVSRETGLECKELTLGIRRSKDLSEWKIVSVQFFLFLFFSFRDIAI